MTINKSSLEERLFWINEIIEKKKAINFISKKSGIPNGYFIRLSSQISGIWRRGTSTL